MKFRPPRSQKIPAGLICGLAALVYVLCAPPIGQPFTYYFGACWNRSGDFTNHVQWEDYVKRFAERRDQPLLVTVEN